MDKGPNGTIKKFPARKNNDFMIKVLNFKGRAENTTFSHWLHSVGHSLLRFADCTPTGAQAIFDNGKS